MRGVGVAKDVARQRRPRGFNHAPGLGDLASKNRIPALGNPRWVVLQLEVLGQVHKILGGTDLAALMPLVGRIKAEGGFQLSQ